MREKTLEELDYYRIREIIAGFCVSEEGKSELLRREPLTRERITEIDRLKTLSCQWQRAIRSKNPVKLQPWEEISAFLKLLQADGSSLEQGQLFSLMQFASSALNLYSSIKTASKELSLKNLLDEAQSLPWSSLDKTLGIISRIIDRNGEMRDLPVLQEIRLRIAAINSEIKASLRKYTGDSSMSHVLENNVPALRADRQVLAVKAGQKNRIPGIVHEVSGSGQTLFIEPEEVVRKNNELLQEEARLLQETRKILRETTSLLHPLYDDLKQALKIMTLLDATYAAACWGAQNSCSYALDCGNGGTGSLPPLLSQARHPLLGEEAVPIDMEWLPGKNVLIITGPNTGGKTVTLKTFALLSLLNQSGFPVPADEGTRLPVFDAVFADIGDNQSIDRSLSTFSAHMKNIAAGVTLADENSLVLLDELGGGTDPQEGGAIAMACLDALIEKKAFVLATTHHGGLKNYGYTSPSCINASVEFDPESLEPTYRLVMGVPGESHALEIAERSGLPSSTVEKARSYLTNQQADVSSLIKGLTQKHAELDSREKEFSAKEKRQNEKAERLERKELGLRQKENELREREGMAESKFLRETRRELENLVRELREGEITREKTLRMRGFINDLTEHEKLQESDVQKEKESIKEEERRLSEQSGSEPVIAENGMKISKLPEERAGSNKKTRRRLSNKEALKTARAGYQSVDIKNPASKSGPVQKTEFTEGAEVLVGERRNKGVLVREEKKGVWLVQLGSIRMSVRQKDIQPAQSGGAKTADYTVELSPENGNGSPAFELRLLGMREEEAIHALQKQLDLCAMTGFKNFSVIHGKGNGILQQAVQDYLSNYPGVKSFRYARPEEGGFGKTYVELL